MPGGRAPLIEDTDASLGACADQTDRLLGARDRAVVGADPRHCSRPTSPSRRGGSAGRPVAAFGELHADVRWHAGAVEVEHD